jgi:hypothetical protein
MNNQKDTQKTAINSYGQSNVSEVKSLSNIPIYEFANKKTEKLVTALYMITDCMDTDDALKGKLRFLGVELLSDMYKLASLSPMDKHVYIPIYVNNIHEILSFIEIANTIGFISEMNTLILKNEFNNLVVELQSYQSKDKHFTFTLDEKMFEIKENKNVLDGTNNVDYNEDHFIKDKRTAFNTMPARPIGVSFMNKKSPLLQTQTKKTNFAISNPADKQERANRIISLIKDKKDMNGNQNGVSIKDISLSFVDCSEKTIQRELNNLVLNGKLKKTGAKRWSRYGLGEDNNK